MKLIMENWKQYLQEFVKARDPVSHNKEIGGLKYLIHTGKSGEEICQWAASKLYDAIRKRLENRSSMGYQQIINFCEEVLATPTVKNLADNEHKKILTNVLEHSYRVRRTQKIRRDEEILGIFNI